MMSSQNKAVVAWHIGTVAYIILAVIFILDLSQGGGIGTLSITLLYGGIVSCIQFLIGRLSGRYLQLSKCIWLAFAVSTLVLAIQIYLKAPGSPNLNNADTVLYFNMMALAFPCGLIGLSIFLMLGNSIFEISPSLYLLSIWGTLFILGFIQWFWIVPNLISLAKKYLHSK